MPSIFGLLGATASVDCHLRACCVRLRDVWKAVRDANERVARIAQREHEEDIAAYMGRDGNGTYGADDTTNAMIEQ